MLRISAYLPRSTCIFGLWLLVVSAASAAERTAKVTFSGVTIPLTVTEPVDVQRVADPVSGGIPFPRGALSDAHIARLALADAQGRRVDSLQRPVALGHWNDGSVKWLLLDFLADVPANGEARFTLGLTSADQRFAEGIRVSENEAAFTVDTGTLKAVINKRSFTFLENVWVDADGNGTYTATEQVVSAPGEMFITLDDAAPGPADAGERDYPDTWRFGMEGGNWLRRSQGTSATKYLASAGDYQISLFRQGATQTVFKVEGWHRNAQGRQFGKYSLYLHFYAGQDFVRVFHTWIMTGDPDKDFIRSMGIDVPIGFAGDQLAYAFGGPYEVAQKPLVLNPDIDHIPFIAKQPVPSEVIAGTVARADTVHILSIGPDKYYHNVPADRDLRVEFDVSHNGTSLRKGFEPSGWADISNGSRGIAVGIRDFWREHPKQMRYRDGTLTAFIWPEDGGRALDLRRRYPDVRGPGPKRGGSFGKAARREFNTAGSAVGVAKTTELFFSFHADDHKKAQIDRDFRAFQDPLRPFADPAWSCATGVFGPILPYDSKKFARIENAVDLSFAWPLRSAEEFHWYGMLDYGDHLLEYESIHWELSVPENAGLFQNWGYSGWMQEAYRTGQWMFVQYLRSGRARYWREAETWLRHHRDVDCCFWDTPDNGPQPQDNKGGNRVGGGHRHDQQHWGTYMTSYGIPAIAVTHHYYLTGDGRDLDAMRAYGDWLLHHNRYENEGVLSTLYLGEALGDQAMIAEAMARKLEPGVGYGRLIFHSGMALMLHDIQTHGAEPVRKRLRDWAAIDDVSAAFIRGYLYSQGEKTYLDRMKTDLETLFPAKSIRTQFFAWAPRKPSDFRDAMSADILPQGVWPLPFRTLEKLVFDSPFGMGNNTSRNQIASQLLWLMQIAPPDPQ